MQKEEEKGDVKITFLSITLVSKFRAVKTEGRKRKFFLPWVGRYFARYQSCLLSSFPSFSYMDGSLTLSLFASETSLPWFFRAEFSAWKKGWMEVYLMVVT